MGDIQADIYKIMDRARFTGGHFLQSGMGMTKLVHQCRAKLAADLEVYIQEREAQAIEKFKQGNV